MINILFEKLPDAVEVSGKYYKIFTDFRDWIAFFDMMSDTEIDQKQKMLTTLSWFAEEIPDNLTEAYKALMDFASCSGIKKIPKIKIKTAVIQVVLCCRGFMIRHMF